MKETANISSFALLNNKAFIAVLLISMGTGYGLVINMSVSPYVADFFNLSEKALVSLFAWTSLGAFGTIYLTRWVDILGRRLLTIICYNLSLIFCVLTAFAPSVITYVIAQFFFVALIGVAFATVTVMAGEYLPAEQRAKGMTLQVLVHALGHGGPMLLIVFLANLDNAWQWMWLSLPLTSLPFVLFVLKNLKEPSVFVKNDKSNKNAWRELFNEKYKQRTLLMSGAYTLATISRSAAFFYTMYFLVSILEMEQSIASAIVVGGGLVGLAGTFLGGQIADQVGRRFCINLFNFLGTLSILALYLLPNFIEKGLLLTICLGLTFCIAWVFETSMTVGIKTMSTELFPTSLRATYGGIMVFLLKIASIISNFAIAILLIWIDDLVTAILMLSSLRLLAYFGFRALPETKGQDLKLV